MRSNALPDIFTIAAGSVSGRDHVWAGKNNQDAYHWAYLEQALIAVVCDGCGSGAHSEVGAQLGARLVVRAIAHQLQRPAPQFWDRVQHEILAQLRHLVEQLGGSLVQTVQDYLLFTVVGAVLTPRRTTLFTLGDGLMALNGELIPLGPFPDNAPPYLAYALLREQHGVTGMQCPGFQIQRLLPTATVQSILLGTDGLDAVTRASAYPIPGKQEIVGPLSQFWEDQRYVTNPDAVRRTLTLLNREVLRPDWQAQRLERQGGLLADDTTLVVLRRRAAPREE